MSKSDEFAALVKVLDNRGITATTNPEAFFLWVAENRELILRALQHEEAYEKQDEPFGQIYYHHELDYMEESLVPVYRDQGLSPAMRRGFKEGWRAFRNYIIQARDAQRPC